MEIKIIKREDGIDVVFNKKAIKVSEKSDTWNSESINKFLITIVSNTPDLSELSINYDQEEKDEQYKLIVNLFSVFKENIQGDK